MKIQGPLVAISLMLLCSPACQKQAESSESQEEVAHGVAGAKPGSYEDWCGEHQVQESLCTRCNRALIPAFKAAKDWCAEHGLPESQCLLCNPDLKIVRPPKKAVES